MTMLWEKSHVNGRTRFKRASLAPVKYEYTEKVIEENENATSMIL